MEWAVSGVFVLFFLVFVVGGLAVMIYALVDAIRMPSDAASRRARSWSGSS